MKIFIFKLDILLSIVFKFNHKNRYGGGHTYNFNLIF